MLALAARDFRTGTWPAPRRCAIATDFAVLDHCANHELLSAITSIAGRFQSKPHANAGHELDLVGMFVSRMCKIRAAPITFLPHQADVRREPPRDFVAQAQAQFRVRQTGADATLRIVLAVEIHLEL